jgi:hypothetical protein
MVKPMSPWKTELKKLVFANMPENPYCNSFAYNVIESFKKLDGVVCRYHIIDRFLKGFSYKGCTVSLAEFQCRLYAFMEEWENIHTKKD